MRERGLKICLQCVDVPKTDFAKGVGILMRMWFQVDCYWICKSEKNSFGRVECVLAGWLWEYVV